MLKCLDVKMKNGFTLVELLVAMAVFIIIVGIASGLFISSIRAQRKILATQELLGQTSYAMEYMSRFLRMAKKELSNPPVCLSERGLNYETNLERNRIRFLNYQNICQEFFLEENQLKERKSTDNTAANFQAPLALTSINLQVSLFNIGSPDSWDQDDDLQPRVALFLEIKGRGARPELQPEIKIQTTISQRDLDITR